MRFILFFKFFNFETFLRLKNFETTFNFFFLAIFATFREGSNPKISYFFFAKYNEKVPVLVPKISQRTFWFDRKKYLSESKFFMKKTEAKFSWRTPSDKKINKKVIKLDSERNLYCFFGQLIDCIKETGFFKASKIKKNGVVYLSIVFDGFPFFNEQFGILKNGPIIESDFSFEKEMGSGIMRYSLSFLDQKIAYFVDRKGNLIDKFWISQGLSLKKI